MSWPYIKQCQRTWCSGITSASHAEGPEFDPASGRRRAPAAGTVAEACAGGKGRGREADGRGWMKCEGWRMCLFDTRARACQTRIFFFNKNKKSKNINLYAHAHTNMRAHVCVCKRAHSQRKRAHSDTRSPT